MMQKIITCVLLAYVMTALLHATDLESKSQAVSMAPTFSIMRAYNTQRDLKLENWEADWCNQDHAELIASQFLKINFNKSLKLKDLVSLYFVAVVYPANLVRVSGLKIDFNKLGGADFFQKFGEDKLIFIIRHMPSLRHVRFFAPNCASENARCLTPVLFGLNLTNLHLQGFDIDGECAQAYFKGLIAMKDLQYLHLDSCHLTDQELEQLQKNILNLNSLEALTLTGNSFSIEAMQNFMRSLPLCCKGLPRLHAIHLPYPNDDAPNLTTLFDVTKQVVNDVNQWKRESIDAEQISYADSLGIYFAVTSPPEVLGLNPWKNI